jgi:hypothetical protein
LLAAAAAAAAVHVVARPAMHFPARQHCGLLTASAGAAPSPPLQTTPAALSCTATLTAKLDGRPIAAARRPPPLACSRCACATPTQSSTRASSPQGPPVGCGTPPR